MGTFSFVGATQVGREWKGVDFPIVFSCMVMAGFPVNPATNGVGGAVDLFPPMDLDERAAS